MRGEPITFAHTSKTATPFDYKTLAAFLLPQGIL